MKRFPILFLVLSLLLVLCACTPDGPSETTPPTEPPTQGPTEEPTEPATFPVDEDVVYFSNALEYDRLYSVRRDGTDLKLVMDEQCYDVSLLGANVYYFQTGNLWAYHIPTASRTMVVEDILDYTLDEDYLAYRRILDPEIGTTDLRVRNLTTGDDFSVCSSGWVEYSMGYGQICYTVYDMDYSHETLWRYEIESGETALITDSFEYISDVFPVSDGVFFQANDGWLTDWYFADRTGGEPTMVECFLPEYCQMTAMTDDTRFYINPNHYVEEEAELHYVGADGVDTVITTQPDSTSIFCTRIADDCWLVEKCAYIGWGGQDEYGYYNNYSSVYEYWLAEDSGKVTKLNAAGELGTMFADGDFPLIDSSTARKPVTRALYDRFVKAWGYEGQEPICATTHGAWLNIADRVTDLAFLAAPTAEEQAYLEEKGVEIEMKLYGGDGLVFFGHADNPVENLTHEQIQGIYRGEITNWKELGGPDHDIIVYYRDPQSGSQRLFNSLVFKGQEAPDCDAISMENPNYWMWDDMGSIVYAIMDNPYAIGYSIMTYLADVYEQEDTQVFTVDGVLPSPETVADASYRYHTQGYVVIRADEPENSPARRLFNWFGSPISDDLLFHNDVTPLHAE